MARDHDHCYLVALGSNRRVPGIGSPRKVISAALAALRDAGWRVEAASRIVDSTPVGPSQRRYANAAAVVTSPLDPSRALAGLQRIETQFGRERRGARWRSRTLDLDIVLWSGGAWCSASLILPHPLFRQRRFVLGPAAEIAPYWRDPVTGRTLHQLAARASARRGA